MNIPYGYIYAIKNLINGKFYIGQTTRNPPELRWKQHINNPGKGSIIDKAIQKYKPISFLFKIIDIGETQEELNIKEEEYICLFGSKRTVNGYNIKNGGSNGKFDKKTRQKLSNMRQKEKHPKYVELDINKIINLYVKKGYNTYEIAQILNCGPTTIQRRLKDSNVKLRDNRKSQCKKGLFGFTGCTYQHKNQNPWTRVWTSRIKYNGHRKFLGHYEDPLSAQIVYKIIRNEITGGSVDTK